LKSGRQLKPEEEAKLWLYIIFSTEVHAEGIDEVYVPRAR